MATYNVVAVRRTPTLSSIPTYVELGPLYPSDVTVTDHKHMMPSEASFTMVMGTLDADTKTALLDLAAQPLEVWVYRDSVRIFAGPVVGGQVNRDEVQLTCRGRLLYLAYMLVTTDKSWTATDLFTIGKAVVDDWQALDYGNFGILTASIGTLGTTRDVEIPGASEFPRVSESLKTISEGAFDAWLDADTGNLEFAGARGVDLSASVVIERGIATPAAGFALGPDLLASEVYASGTTPDAVITTSKSDTALRQTFGRAGSTANFDPVSDTDHLSDLAQAQLDSVGTVYFNPGGNIVEVPEADFDDLEPGNTVQYSFDFGLGKMTADVRINKRTLSVGQDGTEDLAVEFE